MLNTDGTVGSFSDVPYFGPVESMSFYDLVRALRLHKLPTTLLTGSRVPSFFAEPELTERISDAAVYRSGKKKLSCKLPDAYNDFDSVQYLFGEDGRSLFTVCETNTRNSSCEKDTVHVTVDTHGANTLWTTMILYLLGEHSVSSFVVPNVDNYLSESSGGCDFMLSLLLVGASNIAHYFSSKPDYVERLRNVSVSLTVLNTSAGVLCGDALQCFLESKLKVAVNRVHLETPIDGFSAEITSHSVVSADEWLDTVKNHLVEAHEDYCDEEDEDGERQKTVNAPVVLTILPKDAAVRQALRESLLDCYTSVPIRFVEESQLTPESFSGHSPVIFACSAGWLSEQARTPSLARVLDKLAVRQVLHTGFREFSGNYKEELTHCFSTVKSLCESQNLALHSVECEEPSFSLPDTGVNQSKTLESCNMVLLFFRRFAMKYSPSSLQPFTALSRDLVLSERGWMHCNQVIEQMTLAGVVVRPKGTHLTDHVELTVLGRCLSFRFRMKPIIPAEELSVVDAKIILWAQLLRQPLHVVMSLLQQRYPFGKDMARHVESFLSQHKLRLDGDSAVVRAALTEQLAVFGFNRMKTVNRTHLFLSSPTGSRKPLQNHYVSPPPTVCRGWFRQAPLESGSLLERKAVDVFCLPPVSLYCEIDGAEKSSGSTVQCPVEISYPLVIAHSMLHIALHNNCVFVESAYTNEVAVSLPTSALQSSVLNTILDHTESNTAGLWLDNCCTDIALTPLDASFLACFPLKGEQQIRVCGRSSFQKKRKRARQEAEAVEDTTTFKGVLPRSQAEIDAISEFVEKVISALGRDVAEKRFVGKKGFGFIDPNHSLHAYYQHVMRHGSA